MIFNNINLKLNTERTSFMSFQDMIQYAENSDLIKLLPTMKRLSDQLYIMMVLEERINEIGEDKYFELLESCNGY